MSNDDDHPVDIENPPTDLEGVNAPLITKPDQTPKTEEEVWLDGIPSVQKPGYGNWIWAEKQCARRSGLTVGEAMAIQAAYRVYQTDGDIQEFQHYVLEFAAATLGSIAEPTGMGSSRWLKPLLDIARGPLSVMDVVIQSSPTVSPVWASFAIFLTTFSTSQNHREFVQERMHTLETLTKLLKLFVPDKDGQSAPQEMSRQDQETQYHTDRALKTDDEQNLPASSAGHTRIPETSQEPAKLVSAVEQTQAKETKPQSGLSDALRLDRKEFDNLIRELLRSRSHESGKQQPADGTSSPFLIIGWFAKGSTDPNERLITLEDDENLFKQIRKRVKFIRGWREYISLKSLCRFGLYKCDIPRGAHVKLSLSNQHASTLSHFFRAYQTSRWHPDKDVSNAWTAWVQKNLNANNEPIEGKYSLELVYNWSPVRLSVLVLFPVLFSFGTGMLYMLKTGDVSTAWTISSYVVTTAGAIVALLAVLGSLKER
ncbi:hypothetical protein EPUS_07894 [Endocarpon pusillum Z07020]|uniref:Uncharacterized protein n=1 Tax=Endocarpon pusillum (strain Z07020 / HMAS-L-300199) TaxID=1263415 RepID=U1GHE7_ENDPU|nr:uncharacterized protein EPUS_07894 [Endocarpon pusillum Z07020]ERF71211.1 hypothetical protein EPUS_07894 [Endocarpon pusillum Z07020]